MRTQLQDILRECGEPNWDGYQADPVLLETAQAAEAFLSLLPDTMQPDEFGADPDGQISMEWTGEGGKLSVSIGPLGQRAFASHGTGAVAVVAQIRAIRFPQTCEP